MAHQSLRSFKCLTEKLSRSSVYPEASKFADSGGFPLVLLNPVLFHLADGKQDVKFTPAQSNGGKLRHGDGPSGKLPDRVTGEER